jgi:hypothetical protein
MDNCGSISPGIQKPNTPDGRLHPSTAGSVRLCSHSFNFPDNLRVAHRLGPFDTDLGAGIKALQLHVIKTGFPLVTAFGGRVSRIDNHGVVTGLEERLDHQVGNRPHKGFGRLIEPLPVKRQPDGVWVSYRMAG